MALKPQMTSLLEKKMDRAGFLKHVGIGVLAVTGVTGVLRALGIAQPSGGAHSYGTSPYGGIKRG